MSNGACCATGANSGNRESPCGSPRSCACTGPGRPGPKIAHRLGRGWRTIDIALRRVGIKPINGNYGGFADNTITWNAWSRQNRIKVQGWWEPLAKVLWKRTHGPVPPGCDVRRIDITLPRDRIDSLENLVMMNRRTQPARVWAAEGVPIPDDPIDRRETLILILTIAAVKAGDTSFKLGTW